MIGFEHIPANFYLLALSMLKGDVEFIDVLWKNWIPTTLGNFVAGAFIVAGSYSYFFGQLGQNAPRDQAAINAAARKSMGIDLNSDAQDPAPENQGQTAKEVEQSPKE